jgi:hypothetical protein
MPPLTTVVMSAYVATHFPAVQAHVVHASSCGQSGFFMHGMEPLELLDEEDVDDVEDDEDVDDDELPPVPLDELELLVASPPAPPVALPGSN